SVLRHERGGRRARPGLHGDPADDGRGRRGRHALGECALARRDARDARARADRRGVRADDRARRAMGDGREGCDRAPRPAVDHPENRRARRVLVLPDAPAADDHELARFTHLYALNRGVLLTPFHNMALMSPATTAEDVDRHSAVFEEMAAELTG